MTREVSRENSKAAEDKDPRAVRPDRTTLTKEEMREIGRKRDEYYRRMPRG